MWGDFLSQMFKSIVTIGTYQHFRMSSSEPRIVLCEIRAMDGSVNTEYSIQLVKEGVLTLTSECPNPVPGAEVSDK